MTLSTVKRRLTIVETEISGRFLSTTFDQKLARIEQLAHERISEEDRALLACVNSNDDRSGTAFATKEEQEALERWREAWVTAIASSRVRFTIKECDSLLAQKENLSQ